MSEKDMRLTRCREVPPCGSPVLNAREHRAWHERVFIAEERTPSVERRRALYVGEPDDDDDDAERDDSARVADSDDVGSGDNP